MSAARIQTTITTIGSLDQDQRDIFTSGKTVVDDTEQTMGDTAHVKLPVSTAYVEIVKPAGMTRIGFLQIETDNLISVRLNSTDGLSGTEIPVTPVVVPPLSITIPAPGPSAIPFVQKGVMVLRAGVNIDGNPVTLTRVWIRNQASQAASIKVIFGGE